jgi:hypothetical protein
MLCVGGVLDVFAGVFALEGCLSLFYGLFSLLFVFWECFGCLWFWGFMFTALKLRSAGLGGF